MCDVKADATHAGVKMYTLILYASIHHNQSFTRITIIAFLAASPNDKRSIYFTYIPYHE